MGEIFGSLTILLMVCVAFVVLFLIFRAIVLWYWKLDKIEEHLRAIRESLAERPLGR